MSNRNIFLGSVLFAVPAVLLLLIGLFLSTRGGGWFSFAVSCPFWSAGILLFIAAIGRHMHMFTNAARFGLFGCLTVGGIAFVTGFLGPILFMPNANQGPLLGICITGPIGTLVGTVLGVLTAITMKRIRQPEH